MKLQSSAGYGVRLLAAGFALISATAIAQQQDATTSEVRVQASGIIKKQLGKTSTGIPIETAEITMVVHYGDLSLDTNSGQALLKGRVADAARDACERINPEYPAGTLGTSDAECINTAIRGAKSQVDSAIAAANPRKTTAQK